MNLLDALLIVWIAVSPAVALLVGQAIHLGDES